MAAHTKSQLALIASSGIAKEDQENSKMEDSIDIEVIMDKLGKIFPKLMNREK